MRRVGGRRGLAQVAVRGAGVGGRDGGVAAVGTDALV